MSATCSSRCGRPAKSAAPRAPRRSTPRASAAAAAAIAFSRLCGPRSRSSDASSNGSPCHTSRPLRGEGRSRARPNHTAGRTRRPRLRTRLRGVQHGDVVGRWLAKMRSFASQVLGDDRVAVEVVLREVQEDRRLGSKRDRVLELEARRLADDRRSPASSPASALTGVPTLPATATGSPAARCIAPSSSTVVVLPFVPVTAQNSFGTQPPADLELADDLDAPARARAPRRARPADARALDERPGGGDAARSCVPSVSRWTSTPARASLSAAASASAGVPASQATIARPGRRPAQRERRRHAGAREPDDQVGAGRQRRPGCIQTAAAVRRRCSAGRA